MLTGAKQFGTNYLSANEKATNKRGCRNGTIKKLTI
jgi:hypothetical protein